MHEYQVPIIVDITATDIEAACAGAVHALSVSGLVGHTWGSMEWASWARVESWWTVEAIAKPFDRNDNESGVVLFEHDLDYLREMLVAIGPPFEDQDLERHVRLLRYLDRSERCGSAI